MSNRAFGVLAFVVLIASAGPAMAGGDANAAKPVLWWSFDSQDKAAVRDVAGGVDDAIEGNFTYMPGPCGQAIKPDGYTTCIQRRSRRSFKLDQALTVSAWVAPAAYPWNWCPVIACEDPQGWGWRLAVGPHGDFALELSVAGRRQQCMSDEFVMPLRRWTHIAGVYDPNQGITLYVNGKPAGRLAVKGKPDWAKPGRVRGLMNYEKVKPSNLYRDYGTLASWFSVDVFTPRSSTARAPIESTVAGMT